MPITNTIAPNRTMALGIAGLFCAPVNSSGLPCPKLPFVANRMSLLPTRKDPDASRLIGAPEIVRPVPPASNVLPFNESSEALPMYVCPSIVNVDRGGAFVGGGDNVTVLLPTINLPEGPRLIGVPEMVIPAPPMESVVESMLNAEGLAVNF